MLTLRITQQHCYECVAICCDLKKRCGQLRSSTRMTRWSAVSLGNRILPCARLSLMELNGALSNPRVQLELPKLRSLRASLLRQAVHSPRPPTVVRRTRTPVLETVTRALTAATRPMRAREVHRAAEELLGQPVEWSSVRSALAACVNESKPRFRRLRRGLYEIRPTA
jgi:hypothetical protein